MSQIVRGSDNVGTGKATGAFAHAEGNNTTASGTYAHAEGNGSTASVTYAHAEGSSTTASGSSAHAEGINTTASANYAHAEGNGSTASGPQSHAEGSSTASGDTSHAEGTSSATRFAQYAKGSNAFSTVGDAQYSNYVHMGSTTDATPKVLTSGNGAVVVSGATTNVLTIGVSRAMMFRAEVIARRTDVSGEAAAFHLTGAFAGTAARLVGTPTTVSWSDSGASTWTVVASIATLSGAPCLVLTATGEAAKAIRWVATVHTTEVG